jgi:hypothetical protein
MGSESATFVQIQPDSTGKKVAVAQAQQVLSDGSQNAVEVQQVGIADQDGRQVEVNTRTIVDVLIHMDETLRDIRETLFQIAACDLRQSVTSHLGREFDDTPIETRN